MEIMYKEREKINNSIENINNQTTTMPKNVSNAQPLNNYGKAEFPIYCLSYPGIDRKSQNILNI
jgi:hypothetical protein